VVLHFNDIRHPELRLFWGAVLFNRNSASPQVVQFLRDALTSGEQIRQLKEIEGPQFDEFKRHVLVPAGTVAGAHIDLGMQLRSSQIPENHEVACAATPSQTYPCLEDFVLDGIRFSMIGYDARTRRVVYLETSDAKFMTKDGLHVGSVIEIPEDQVLMMTGWKIYGPKTKDGWHPILGSSLMGGEKLKSVDGEPVDLSKRVIGKNHRFKIIGLEKGGV